MDKLFWVNIALSVLILGTLGCINLLNRPRKILQVRMGVLGLLLAALIPLFFLQTEAMLVPGPFPVGASLFLASLAAFEFALCIAEITSPKGRKSRIDFCAFPVSAAVGVSAAFAPRPVYIFAAAAVIIGTSAIFTITRLLVWILTTSDIRARRDGEWLLILISLFVGAFSMELGRDPRDSLWTLVIWYVVMYISVNYLKISDRPVERENRLIIDNVSDIVMLLDAGGRIVRMNQRGLQVTGYSPELAQGMEIDRIVIIDDPGPPPLRDRLARFADPGLSSGGRRNPSIDAFLVTSSAEEIPVDLRIIAIQEPGRKISGYVVSATDLRITRQLMREISDREYAARDLAASEKKFSQMFVFNPVGILIVDLGTGRITDANPSMEVILERESKSVIGMTLAEIGVEMQDMSMDMLIDLIQMEGSVSEFGANIRTSPQAVRKCRLSAVAFELNRTRSMLLSVADVTEQESLREALTRKQQVETVGILAGGIAHDFNNILAVILGQVGIAKMRIVETRARESLEKAENACLRAREMTSQLLAFSRGGKPIIGLCDTRSLIVDSAMLSVSDTAVACLFNVEKDIWPLKADRIQIGQVISNLVGNAVDAMEKSGIIEVQARNVDLSKLGPRKRPRGLNSQALAPGPYVEIRIHDQGPGIPDDIRQKIFDPFFTTKEKGTGLGLSIVYSVVQNHAGSIRVESAKNEGTTFVICLPADSAPAVAEQAACPGLIPGQKKVLLMDDDPLVRESAASMLAGFGLDVTQTSDGREAVDAYRAAMKAGRTFDFCILDLVIPGGMSGIDCAKEIRALDPESVLVVSSGYSDDPVLSHSADYGFRDIIPKPYTVEEMQKVLARVLVL